MRKFKFFLNLEKEEQWLSDMEKKGYRIVDTSFGYKFRSTDPEEVTIKSDYRKFKSQEDFIDYCTLFEDSGWKHIAGKKNSGHQYFKKVGESHDDIFSDGLSKAGKFKRMSNDFLHLSIGYLPILLVLLMTGIIDIRAFVNPKHLYLTPSLWEMTGSSFWFAFLFETPFAFLRAVLWSFLPILIIGALIYAFRAQLQYKKSMS